MGTDKKALTREFLEHLHAGDIDGALAYTTGHAAFIVFNNEIPDGIRAIGGMIPAMFKQGPHREYTGQYVDGDTVVSEITITGTTIKDDLYQNYYLIITHFDGDKISKVREYMDTAYANTKFSFA